METVKHCPNCGAEVADGANVCAACGRALGAEADAPRDAASDANAPVPYACPQCEASVPVIPIDRSQLVACPGCGAEFVVPAMGGATEEAEASEESAEQREIRQQGELDGMKIRNLIVERRAVVRTRTYFLVALVGCVTAVIELSRKTFVGVRQEGWHTRQVAMLTFAIAMLLPAQYFFVKVREYTREMKKTLIAEPDKPPSFETLRDGSQQVEDLEKL